MAATWESDPDELAQLVGQLKGTAIDAVDSINRNAADPTLHFNNGAVLRIMADTDIDPWVMLLPDVVIVGEMP
jgi:hypothetical protein